MPLPVYRCSEQELDFSIKAIQAGGFAVNELRDRVAEQNHLLSEYERELNDLRSHRDAACSETKKAEEVMHRERERAERAEQQAQDLQTRMSASQLAERRAAEQLAKIMNAVNTTLTKRSA